MFLFKIKQLYDNPVLILGQGYIFLKLAMLKANFDFSNSVDFRSRLK